MRFPALGVLLFVSMLLSGCFTEYRLDIPQGNVVTPAMIAELKPGMTKRQVRFALGAPLITDPFHPERWDYFYSLSKAGGKPEQRRLTLFFKDDSLTGASGDMAPADLKGTEQNNPPAVPKQPS